MSDTAELTIIQNTTQHDVEFGGAHENDGEHK